MADANPGSELAQRLDQFKRWYSQAGTPQLRAEGSYDAAARTYTLTLSQSCAPTPGQAEKLPFVIPVQMGLLGQDGRSEEHTSELQSRPHLVCRRLPRQKMQYATHCITS